MRTLHVLGAAFGALMVLMLVASIEALQRVSEIYDETSAVHSAYADTQRALARVETNIYEAGVLVRDYLLDPSHIMGDYFRRELRNLQTATQAELKRLSLPAGQAAASGRLQAELDKYWDSFEPLFNWTPQQKMSLSYGFLRNTVLPHRDAAEKMARVLGQLNKENLARQERELELSEQRSRAWLVRLFAVTLALSILVAGMSLWRIHTLETRAGVERLRIERAEDELRRLSQQLVRAQEEERRSLSRELHDEVGQMLTALRVEIGNLDRLREASPEGFSRHVREVKQLAEQSLRSVRDMAMGLRPSMLDDLGLGAAVEWQARDFERRHNVPVNVEIEGGLDTLPDGHRPCIFRVVQEALTHVARHAKATEVRISVHGFQDRAFLTVHDNGAGFDVGMRSGTGLGLIGIQERVRQLGGAVTWKSQPGRGTVLNAEIPVPQPRATVSQETHA